MKDSYQSLSEKVPSYIKLCLPYYLRKVWRWHFSHKLVMDLMSLLHRTQSLNNWSEAESKNLHSSFSQTVLITFSVSPSVTKDVMYRPNKKQPALGQCNSSLHGSMYRSSGVELIADQISLVWLNACSELFEEMKTQREGKRRSESREPWSEMVQRVITSLNYSFEVISDTIFSHWFPYSLTVPI